jgi:holo-[acyl-carrier protein] synthase
MVGVDLVRVERIEKLIEKFGKRALERFLTKDEIARAKSVQSYAGYWAAKEAVSKALGSGIGKELAFHDIIISKDEKGAPSFTLPKTIIETKEIIDLSLSITHDHGYAIAVAAVTCKTHNKAKLYH